MRVTFSENSLKLNFSVVDIEVLLSQHSPSSVIQYHVDLRFFSKMGGNLAKLFLSSSDTSMSHCT